MYMYLYIYIYIYIYYYCNIICCPLFHHLHEEFTRLAETRLNIYLEICFNYFEIALNITSPTVCAHARKVPS